MPRRPVSVLLVHANPFQRVMPVPPYGLERVRTAAEAAGAEVTILDPYLFADDPLAAAAEAAERLAPDVVGLGLRVLDDCITVAKPEGPPGRPIDVTWFMPEVRRLRDRLAEAAPDALFLAGGAAFSTLPGECLDYLEIDHGVVGTGEQAIAEIVRRLDEERPLAGVPGLVTRGEESPLSRPTTAGLDRPTRREPHYTAAISLPVRTRTGCAMACSYCLTANMLRRHADADLGVVLDEIESIVEQAAGLTLRQVPVFFADDELNLPDDGHVIRLLRGVVERGLGERIRWRAYFNPTPFSAELAELVRETNGQVSLTVDTVAEPVMKRAQKPFRIAHLRAVLELLADQGVNTDVGLIFGLPGETEATVAETVAFARSLPPEVRVAYSAGARVYPHTPLAAIARDEPEHLHGGAPGDFFEPTVFCSPVAPRELAQRLADAFADLPNVRPVTLAYRGARETLASAYRVVLGADGRQRWLRLLDEATVPDSGHGTPAQSLLTLVHVAEWHGRFDLARLACRKLAALADLPDDVRRGQLRVAQLYFRWRSLTAPRGRGRRRATTGPLAPSGAGVRPGRGS